MKIINPNPNYMSSGSVNVVSDQDCYTTTINNKEFYYRNSIFLKSAIKDILTKFLEHNDMLDVVDIEKEANWIYQNL